MNTSDQAWWKSSTVYQIYPRSFCDSNGDGIGDMPGITAKLDHLKTLGVDVVWLSPVYQSPNDDNGYDISDYRAIMGEFGTMADFDAMLAGMSERGMALMMDLVVNHTSDEHEWFRQARSSRDNPYHDYYIWQEPVEGRAPTNWESAFSGSAWSLNEATGEYYLHMFSPKQPDLNWENPKVRAEVYDLMHFWFKKGVRGFRMDVINLISKPWRADGSLPDAPVVQRGFLQPAFEMVKHGPRFVEFMREMRREVLDHYNSLTVGESPCATVEEAAEITHPDTGALNMVFQFEHMDLDSQAGKGKWALKALHLPDLKASLSRWQNGLHGRGWNSLYWNNHDQPRIVSRFGDDSPAYRERSAKMLATCLHLMQGTPYVYQGEELGMTNVAWPDITHYQDIETRNMYRVATQEKGQSPDNVLRSIHAKGRDNARTPMQWDASRHAGFSTAKPWIALNDNYMDINATEQLARPDSLFHCYRQLIELRKAHPVIRHGDFELLDGEDPERIGYRRHWQDPASGERHTLLLLANLTAAPLPMPHFDKLASDASLLMGNYPKEPTAIFAPYQATAWLSR